MNTTVENLKQELKQLVNQLRVDYKKDSELLTQIRAKEAEIKAAERLHLLNDVNAKQSRLRTLAKFAYECEQPEADITNSDGSFHAKKAKKYPNIAYVAANHYGRAKWRDGRIVELNLNGERFQMYWTKNEYNQPTQYTCPESFEEFLKLNGIASRDITEHEYAELIEKTEAINKALKEAIEKHSQSNNRENLYFYSNIGLLSQRNAGQVYQFEAR